MPTTNAPFDPRASRSPEYLASKRAMALRRWFVALANRASAPADIMTITNSILEGNGLTSYLGRIPHLAMTKLRTLYPTAGVTGGLGYIAPYMATGQAADWPVVNTGGSSSTPGLGSRSRFLSASGHKSVFSFSNATHVGIRYFRAGSSGAAGHFTYQIDAGSTTDVDCKLSTTSDFIEILLTIPDTGAHSVTVQWVSGAVILDGFVHYNGDSTAAGIRLWEGGHGGGSAATFMGSGTLIGYLGNQASQIQPDVVVIELGANDRAANTSAATFATSVGTILSTIRANVTIAPSFVLIPVWPLGDPSVVYTSTWPEYVNAIYAIADADPDICVLDFQQRVLLVQSAGDRARGLLSNAEGTYSAHPNDQGASYLADVIARYLSPQ